MRRAPSASASRRVSYRAGSIGLTARDLPVACVDAPCRQGGPVAANLQVGTWRRPSVLTATVIVTAIDTFSPRRALHAGCVDPQVRTASCPRSDAQEGHHPA